MITSRHSPRVRATSKRRLTFIQSDDNRISGDTRATTKGCSESVEIGVHRARHRTLASENFLCSLLTWGSVRSSRCVGGRRGCGSSRGRFRAYRRRVSSGRGDAFSLSRYPRGSGSCGRGRSQKSISSLDCSSDGRVKAKVAQCRQVQLESSVRAEEGM